MALSLVQIDRRLANWQVIFYAILEVVSMRKLKKYKPTKFMAKTSHYDKDAADYAVMFIESLCHTKGTWAGKPFELIDWQEQIIRDLFGVLKPNGYRQFNTAYIEIPKKQGKSELAAAVALLLLCGDGEERAEVYGCAADRNQAKIVFDVAVDMVRFCPALFQAGEDTGVPEKDHLSSYQLLLPGAFGGCGEQARFQYPRRDLR